MNHFCTWLHPAPSCPIPALHPARAHIPACNVDVSETWNRHSVYQLGDDYDRVLAEDWLSAAGGFK